MLIYFVRWRHHGGVPWGRLSSGVKHILAKSATVICNWTVAEVRRRTRVRTKKLGTKPVLESLFALILEKYSRHLLENSAVIVGGMKEDDKFSYFAYLLEPS